MEIGNEFPNLSLKVKILITVLSGLFYGGTLYLFNLLLDEPLFNSNLLIFQGISFGLFLGFGMPYISKKYANKRVAAAGNTIIPELAEDENIETEGPANLFRGLESVGGKLFLTNKKIIFKSHKLNIQTGQTNIDYTAISEVLPRKTGGIIDNGIRIKTRVGSEFDLVVNERDKWMENLNSKIMDLKIEKI